MLSQRLCRWMQMMISGALLLSFVIASVVSAQAATLSPSSVAVHSMQTTHHVTEAGAGITSTGHRHNGSPCTGHHFGHNEPCCAHGGCQMVFGWIVAPSTSAPTIMPTASVYLTNAVIRSDGIEAVPTLRPPRRIG